MPGIAAALTGHSPAGGAVLAICADYRVLAEGPYRIGFNEVEVGLPVPEVICRVLVHVLGQRTAERLAVSGALLGPAEALRFGLVDELAPVAEVVPRAIAWLDGVIGRAPAAVAATRRRVRQPLFDAFATVDSALIETVLEFLVLPRDPGGPAGAGGATGARAPAGYSRPMTLEGKTLFITGASRGIGKAIAMRAARDGARIVIAAKTTEPHPKLPGTIFTAADESAPAGGEALPITWTCAMTRRWSGRSAGGRGLWRHRRTGEQRVDDLV